MQIGWNILWFIVGVSLLVTVHEFGHFWVARKLGFKVLRFSVGFGKPLYKRVGAAPDHTEFVIAALPLGGYVRMLDERDGAVSAGRPAARLHQQAALATHPRPAGGSRGEHPVRHPRALGHVLGQWHQPREAGGGRGRRRFAGRRRGPAPTATRSAASMASRSLDQVDASLGLLDAVSDDGEAVMTRAQPRRRGAHRHARDRRSGRCATSSPSPTSSTWAWASNTGRRRFPPCSARSSRAVPPTAPASRWATKSRRSMARRCATSASFATTCARARARKSPSCVRRGGSELDAPRRPSPAQTDGGQTVGRLRIGPRGLERSLSTGDAHAHAGRAAERASLLGRARPGR